MSDWDEAVDEEHESSVIASMRAQIENLQAELKQARSVQPAEPEEVEQFVSRPPKGEPPSSTLDATSSEALQILRENPSQAFEMAQQGKIRFPLQEEQREQRRRMGYER